MARDRDGKGKRKPDQSPISTRQRQLDDERRRASAEEERLKRLIEDAPAKREELEKKRRNEFIKRKSAAVRVDGAIVERQFDVHAASAPVKPRKTRKERGFGPVVFVLLVIAFCVAVYWAMRVMGQ